MGLFDKKTKGTRKGEDFDSPVETIDLDTASSFSPTKPSEEDEPAKAVESDDGEETAEVESEPPAKTPKPRPAYGIEEAIALMRTLPDDSVELVVRVVKHTLESTNIDIPSIIGDATDKQNRITDRIQFLKDEILGLEGEIATRKEEIDALEKDHEETSLVKERLELAEKLEGKPSKPEGKGAAPKRNPTIPPPVPETKK